MKKLSKLILASLFFIGLINITFAGDVAKPNEELLFVMLSKKVAIHQNKTNSKNYQVILTNVSPDVVYFTNRPVRKTGYVSLQKFLTLWKKGTFKDVAPNAVIEAISMHMKPSDIKPATAVSYAVTLTNPVYDSATNVVTFDATPLSNQKIPNMSHADYTAVFIDNVNIGRIVG